MAPTYKLSYFGSRGLAEPIRFLLAYGGLDYEDNRVPRDDWPALKTQMPMGEMPVLEVDGKKYHQNVSIARYIAKKVGLVGKDDEENVIIDSVVDSINDLRIQITRFYYENDPEIKERLKKALFEEKFPFYYEKFDTWAAENNGYLCLGKLTWADVYFTALMETIHKTAQIDLHAKYKNLTKVQEHVLSNNNIKKWVETRPKIDT